MDDKRIDPSEVRAHFVARQLAYWARHPAALNGWTIEWIPNYWLLFGNKKLFPVDRDNAKAICSFLLSNLVTSKGLHRFYSGAVIFAMEGLPPSEQQAVRNILETYYVV